MRASRSETVPIRGIDCHVRRWGPGHAPPLVLLHGSQDVSASWQFVVDALERDWQVVAPDWRGHGLSGRSGADTYWFPDYVADLDALLEHVTPDAPARLVGHSMGAQVAALYAGVRPDRVARLVNVDGFGPPGGRQRCACARRTLASTRRARASSPSSGASSRPTAPWCAAPTRHSSARARSRCRRTR